MTLAESTDAPARQLAYATPETAKVTPGRRDFFSYHDLGVADASLGQLKAQVQKSKAGLLRPTGWHYHTSEGQFIYILKGWVDLDFETGDSLRVSEGESLYIPGGMKHNETATSDVLEVLEISVPAEMGTVACDPPAGRRRAS